MQKIIEKQDDIIQVYYNQSEIYTDMGHEIVAGLLDELASLKSQLSEAGEAVAKTETEQLLEEIVKELSEFNPYPESVFIPIKGETIQNVVRLLNANGYSTDSLYGNWGREVWNNCVYKLKKICESQLEAGEEKKQERMCLNCAFGYKPTLTKPCVTCDIKIHSNWQPR